MDPDANLREQNESTNAGRLRELRIALADWLESGGFAPHWQRYPFASADFGSWCQKYRPRAYREICDSLIG